MFQEGRNGAEQQVFKEFLAVKTEQKIMMDNNKPRDCNIAVTETDVHVKLDYLSKKNVSFTASVGDVTVDANIQGKKTYLASEQGSIAVHDKEVEGLEAVHLKAKIDVKVSAIEEVRKGKYCKEIHWWCRWFDSGGRERGHF